MHALSLRVVKTEAEFVVAEQLRQNKHLQSCWLMFAIIQKQRKILAEYGGLAPQGVTVYRFKSLNDIESVSELEQIEGLSWQDRLQHRIRLLID